MTVKELTRIVLTDEFVIVDNDNVEEILSNAKGSWKEIKKYYDREVIQAIPLNNSIEITVK